VSDPFALQRRINRKIVKDQPTIDDGMRFIHGQLAGTSKSSPWDSIKGIDWTSALHRFVEWLDALATREPPTPPVSLLWVEVPSDLNPATSSVLGFPKFMRELSEFGVPSQEACWPSSAALSVDGACSPESFPLDDLEAVLVAVGWRQPIASPSESDRLAPKVYALSHAYTSLLVLNALPLSRVPRLADTDVGLAVTIGWHDGDVEPLALLRNGAWERFPLPSAYGRRRLDANTPQLATRNLLLGRYIDASAVRQRLREGADVRAVDEHGLSVLHVFGAADLDIFKTLLDAGADPCVVTPHGISVLDHVFNDGRATAAHVRLLLDRGAAFAKSGDGWRAPLHALADSHLYCSSRFTEVRDLLELILGLGYNINAIDEHGQSPLWVALVAHANELTEFIAFQHEQGYIGGVWDYELDKVAALLLDRGADPNARLNASSSPLIPPNATPLMVRRYDDARLVKALLKAGADPTLKSDEGRTALDYAREEAQADPGDLFGVDPTRAATVANILERAMRAHARSKRT